MKRTRLRETTRRKTCNADIISQTDISTTRDTDDKAPIPDPPQRSGKFHLPRLRKSRYRRYLYVDSSKRC